MKITDKGSMGVALLKRKDLPLTSDNKLDVKILNEVAAKIYSVHPEMKQEKFYKFFIGEKKGDSLVVQEMITVDPQKGMYGRADMNMINKQTKGGIALGIPKESWNKLLIDG